MRFASCRDRDSRTGRGRCPGAAPLGELAQGEDPPVDALGVLLAGSQRRGRQAVPEQGHVVADPVQKPQDVAGDQDRAAAPGGLGSLDRKSVV